MRKIVMILLWGLAACACSAANEQNTAHKKPNIILIMADDLGFGDLGSYGNIFHQTPNIDYMAAHGVKFLDYHANGPVCTPTRAALLTGQYPQRSGLQGVLYAHGPTRKRGLSLKKTTIAEVLKQAGYRTGMMGKWHLGYKKKYNPVHQGFDVFWGFVSGNIDYYSHYDGAGEFDWWHNTQLVHENGYVTHLITQHAVDFIEQNKTKPFFLYVAYSAPHFPYQDSSDSAFRPNPKKRVPVMGPAKHRIRTYYNMIEIMDRGIGKIMQMLNQEGLARNTMIIFCSDNGARSIGNNGVLRAGKTTLFEGGIRVPAIVYWPGRIKKDIARQPVMSFDFFPTILSVAGIPVPEGLTLDGVDLSPVLFGEGQLPDRFLFWQYRRQQAVRRGPWKLLINNRGKEPADTLLFNLTYDLREHNNVKGAHPAVVEKLLSALQRWEEKIGDLPQKTY